MRSESNCIHIVLTTSPSMAGVLVMLSAWGTALGGIFASRILFSRLLATLLHCPMSFYECVLLGQVLNRCCEDVAEIDYVLPFTIRSMANCVLLTVGTLAVIVYTSPYAACPIPILAAGYYGIQVGVWPSLCSISAVLLTTQHFILFLPPLTLFHIAISHD